MPLELEWCVCFVLFFSLKEILVIWVCLITFLFHKKSSNIFFLVSLITGFDCIISLHFHGSTWFSPIFSFSRS